MIKVTKLFHEVSGGIVFNAIKFHQFLRQNSIMIYLVIVLILAHLEESRLEKIIKILALLRGEGL